MQMPWIEKNSGELHRRFPRLAGRLLPHVEGLSTSAFALAVAEEFLLLTALTLLAVELELYSFWAGMLVGFFLHLLAHIVQTVIYRRYTPVIISSLFASVYCVYALAVLSNRGDLDWGQVLAWTVVALVVLVLNLGFALWLAGRFDGWLRDYAVS